MHAPAIEIIGRTTSHFTRVARIFAHELGVPLTLVDVPDLRALDAEAYGGNPALKIPSLRVGTSLVFGAENVCRKLVELAGRRGDPRLVFAEHVTSDLVRSAQEMTEHAMTAQVQLVVPLFFGDLPLDHFYFRKIRAGFEGSLAWLDAHLPRVLAELPAPRDLSLFEVSLFCLVEHLAFRRTRESEAPPALRRFAAEFARRASAEATPYVAT